MDCARILVLVDGSAASDSALQAACALAEARRAAVAVAHVALRPRPDDPPVTAALADLEGHGVPATGKTLVTRRGEEPAAAAAYADEVGADLVVVGTRGLAGTRAVLLGSFSQRLAAEIDLPLVLVRAQGTAPAPDFDRWVVGTADLGEAARLVETVAGVAPGSRVHVVTVDGAIGDLHVTPAHARRVVKEAVARARELGLLASGQVVSAPEVAPVLLRLAGEHDCRAIILGSRRPRPVDALLLGSVAQSVVHSGRLPVLLAGRR